MNRYSVRAGDVLLVDTHQKIGTLNLRGTVWTLITRDGEVVTSAEIFDMEPGRVLHFDTYQLYFSPEGIDEQCFHFTEIEMQAFNQLIVTKEAVGVWMHGESATGELWIDMDLSNCMLESTIDMMTRATSLPIEELAIKYSGDTFPRRT